MKTIVLEKPGELRFTETAAPTDVPAGHALIRINRVGICGTDWHAYRGRQPFFTYPRILGHELGVTVEKINDPASSLNVGDRCAVEPYLNCGHCIACRNGKSNCCVSLQVLGVHTDGGMRDHIVVPTNKLHKSDKLSAEQLALVETLAIGCHAVDRAAIKKGETILVIGAGPIGLSVIPFAKAAGAEVILMDVSAARLEFCRQQMNAAHVINAATTDPLEALKELTNGDLPTVVFDATGNPQSMMKTFEYAAAGGRIIFISIVQADITFNDPNFHRRELTLLSSRNARPQDFVRIIALLEDGTIDTTPWITHRVPAGDLVESMARLILPEAGVIKAMVEF